MKNLLIIFSLLLSILAFGQKVERIEPPNWWIGMKYNTITLLVYGKDISDLEPKISYKGVRVLKTEKVENQNYLFLHLHIDEKTKPGIVKINFQKDNQVIISKDFPLMARENDVKLTFSQKDAMYLIVPDRFANGDLSNDVCANCLEKTVDRNKDGSRHGGDIQGMINHLDYLQKMGFTQVWCTPLIENDEPSYSYHGYAATDFYKIDPRFGTNELFKYWVSEAKKRGIGIVWDVVLNHCGTEYYFIKDLPSKDWVNFQESHTRTNHQKSTIYDPYATQIDKSDYLHGWFDHHMADLNHKNPLVAKYLNQNTLWWIEYAGISGIREDTYSYVDKDFLSQWCKIIREEYPNFNIVGEEMSRNAAQVSYWQEGKKNADGYQSSLPSLMDFAINDNIINSLNQANPWFSTWNDTYQGIAQDYHFPSPQNLLIFPDNHDLDRFFTRLKGDFDHWKLGITMYMTMRGILQFYYGTEVLMMNEQLGNDGQRRSDFYGGWKDDVKNAKTGFGLNDKEKEAQDFCKRLLNWRKNNEVISKGKYLHFAPQKNDVFVYFRYTETQKVMVLLNKNAQAVDLSMDRYKEMIPNRFKAKDIISDRELTIENVLTISAKTAMILEIKNEQ